MTTKLKKKQKIRNNEYYNMQEIFDNLYSKSRNNQNFTKLLEIITSNENILLAYRNVKKNKGSKTSGTNYKNIIDIGNEDTAKLINYVKLRMEDFKPHSVKRVEIEKDNGKKRPLGIPTIEDRLIQQCIKQVLEPICEAKFHKHSYGFRPNRGTSHAMARAMFLCNRQDFYYVVDIDIKGFFDNVNHAKLIKQMWALGIRDKKLLCIISKMLKANIRNIGIPTKGTPQGGILSPLLSNIVLNELDWWLSSQWETYKANFQYNRPQDRYSALKKSNLKEFFFVRYADDFKIFCKNKKTAKNIFKATELWLKERLGLEISPEKSKIVNLRKQYSTFLGMKFKVWKKGKKYVVKSQMTDKSIEKCKVKLREKLKILQKQVSEGNVHKYNASVLGMHNYYKMATKVNLDFNKIAFEVRKSLYCRTKRICSKNGKKNKAYIKFYGDYGGKNIYILETALYPITCIKTKPPINFSQDICNYTSDGRTKIHDKLHSVDSNTMQYLMENPVKYQSTEFNDNRISLYVGQCGKCYITGERLTISEMEVHHKTPKVAGGTDIYENLVFVTYDIHKLIHATEHQTIEKYQIKLQKTVIDYKKLNKLRVLVGNCEINENK